MKLYISLFLLLVFGCADINPSSPTISENECVDGSIIVCSLSNGMIIEVSLPPNYSESLQYPIMFFNDGESAFRGNGLNAKGIIDKLINESSIQPIIAVAIYAKGNRNNLYIPYEDEWIKSNWGVYYSRSEAYYNEIATILLPFLEERYSINTEEIGIGGVSLGGLVSTWMGLRYPGLIKYSASLSGSFWVDDYKIFDEVNEFGYASENKFWFDIGATTGEWNYYVPLFIALDSVGVEPGIQSFYFEEKDAQHTFPDWRGRLEFPLKIFFGTTEPTEQNFEVILECINSSSTPGLRFRRMNPVMTLSNGVTYSLAHTASYTLISGNTELGTEGSFVNDPEVESKVEVSYKDFYEEITIPVGWCH